MKELSNTIRYGNSIYNNRIILNAKKDAYKLIQANCKKNKHGKCIQKPEQVHVNSKDMADLLFKDIPFVAGETSNTNVLYVYSFARRCYTSIQSTIELYFGLIFLNYKHRDYQDIHTQILVDCFTAKPSEHKSVDLVTYHLPYKFVVCGNGLYDRVNKTLIPNTFRHFIRSTITTPLVTKKEFNVIKNKPVFKMKYKSHHKLVRKTITAGQFVEHFFNDYSNNDKGVKLQLYQVILRCLEPGYPDKCVFLIGSACTGKSSYLNFIKALIGSSTNYSSLNVTDMKSDRDLEGLDTSMCNLGDDSGDNPHVSNNQLFKSIITGDTIRIDAKFEKPYSTTLKLQFVQATNDMFTFDGQSKGIARRIIFIPFKHKMSKHNTDYIPNAVMQQLVHNLYIREYLLYKVTHLPRFTDFSETPQSKKLMDKFKNRDDHTLTLINDFNEWDIERIPKSIMFKNFKNYCTDNGFKYTSSPKFYEAFLSSEQGKYTEKRELLNDDQVSQITSYLKNISYGDDYNVPQSGKMYRCFVQTKKGKKSLIKSNHSSNPAIEYQIQNLKKSKASNKFPF